MARSRVRVDTRQLKQFSKGLHDDIDYQKVLESFMSGVTSSITRKQGRPYTYATPVIGMPEGKGVGSGGRRYLRSRTGKLMEAVRQAKFTKKVNKNQYDAGYDLATILSLAPHARAHLNTDENGTITFTTLYPKRGKFFYIPLKNAQNAKGVQTVQPPTLYKTTFAAYEKTTSEKTGKEYYKGVGKKKFMFRSPTGEVYGGKIFYDEWEKISVEDAIAKGYDFSGEDTQKLMRKPNLQILGKNNIPYFVLAKKIKIPNRLTLQKELVDNMSATSGYYSLRNRLQTEVNRLLRKMAKRR